MKVETETKPYDTINVTPMLDLAYVLLVIFIIMTTASVQGMKINLPKRKPSFDISTSGRNAPCPCGSGKKFKQCCGKEEAGESEQ